MVFALCILILQTLSLRFGTPALTLQPTSHPLDTLILAGNASLARRYDYGPSKNSGSVNHVTIGESYAAGVGAGNIWYTDGSTECGRRARAFGSQFDTQYLGSILPNRDYYLDACSAKLTSQMTTMQVPLHINQNTAVVTISAGGNDFKFGESLRRCIVFPDQPPAACDNAVNDGLVALYSTAFYDDYTGLLNQILDQTAWPNGATNGRTTIYQTEYPLAFDELSTQCNAVSFSIGSSVLQGSILGQDLRRVLNNAVAELNAALGFIIDSINYDRTGNGISPIKLVYSDERFHGHRFCNRDIQEPSLNNGDIWLFHPRDQPELGSSTTTSNNLASIQFVDASAYDSIAASTCTLDTESDDYDDAFECVVAQGIASQGLSALSPDTFPPPRDPSTTSDHGLGFYAKTFHPKASGHHAIAQEINQRIQYSLPSNGGGPRGRNLRILSIGDSITWGFQSTEGSGYRKPLYDILTAGGANQVNFVGTQTSGQGGSAWEHSEGYPTLTTSEIYAKLQASNALADKPNVILLMSGTNDVNAAGATDSDILTASVALSSMINYIRAEVPDAILIVAHIISIGDGAVVWPPSQKQQLAFYWNALVSQIVNTLATLEPITKALKVHTTPTYAEHAAGDSLHPSDAGYQTLAYDFAERISDADIAFGIPEPLNVPGLEQACSDLKPNWIPQGLIANGGGTAPSPVRPVICVDNSTVAGQQLCACLYYNVEGLPTTDDPGVTELVDLVGPSCAGMSYYDVNAVQFADLDGDGRAEYLYVGLNGDVTAFYNQGPKDNLPESTTGAEVSWDPIGKIASGVGGKRWEIQFADLTGDGRADYLWVHMNGSVSAWLNLGQIPGSATPANVNWAPQGIIAGGIGYPGSNIQFADLNGDGRAEYLAVHSNGAVDCYLNGGSKIDNGPHADVINWIPQGTIAKGVNGASNQTTFADIDGDGRADYLEINRLGSGSVHLWHNAGGPNDGPNAAQVTWIDEGSITGGDGTLGQYVVFADLNGDGRAEYIEFDPLSSNVAAYLNGCSG